MAKKTKAVAKSGKKHHHKSKMSGIKATGLMDDVVTLVGLGIGQLGSTMIQRQATSLNPKLVGAIEVGGGLILKKHIKSSFVQAIGWGVAGAGFMGLAHDFGVIRGVDQFCDNLFNKMPAAIPMMNNRIAPATPTIPAPAMMAPATTSGLNNWDQVNGLNNFDMVSGLNNFSMMSGAEEDWMKTEYLSAPLLG